MLKVFKYSFLDLMRNRWTIAYALFFALCSAGLLYLSGDGNKVIVSAMNIVLLLVPLVSVIYGQMYLYQVREYVELLLAQPISRKAIFMGYYLGISTALSLSLLVGFMLPALLLQPSYLLNTNWLLLIVIAVVLTFIFTGLACWLVLKYDNRLKGFGAGLFIWLLLAVLYDGAILVILLLLEDYPLEKLALVLSMLNPIDMGRMLLIFQLDYSALMGYTGAVFSHFFGTRLGGFILTFGFGVWLSFPIVLLLSKARKKDF